MEHSGAEEQSSSCDHFHLFNGSCHAWTSKPHTLVSSMKFYILKSEFIASLQVIHKLFFPNLFSVLAVLLKYISIKHLTVLGTVG